MDMPGKIRRGTFAILAFIVAFAVFAVYLTLNPQLTGYSANTTTSEGTDLAQGWTTQDGTDASLDHLGQLVDSSGSATIQRRLPAEIDTGQALNITSSNLTFRVFYDGDMIFEFDPARKPFDMPYATTYNSLPLAPADAGKLVRIEFEPVFPEMAAQLLDVRMCDAITYVQAYVRDHAVAVVESTAIFFIGLVIIALHIALRNVDHGNLDLFALGISFLLLATWSGAVTTVLQLVTGLGPQLSALEYLSLLFVPYPIVRFTLSLLQPRRRALYDLIAAVAAIAAITLTAVLAFAMHIDMHRLLIISHAQLVVGVILVVAQAVSSARSHGREAVRGALESNNALVYAFLAFVVCAVADFVMFVSSAHGTSDAGFFMRHGLFVFAVVVAISASRASLTYISRAKYADTIELIAYSDALTQVGNRAAWKVMRQEVDAALEAGTVPDAVVCQFDVNFLKKVNDSRGHAAGDLRLKHSAETIQRSYGMEGSVYRTGGDEFTAIIAGDMLDERLRQCQELFETSMAEQDAANETGVPLSMAVGAARVGEVEPHTVREAQKLADKRMYENKRAMKAERED